MSLLLVLSNKDRGQIQRKKNERETSEVLHEVWMRIVVVGVFVGITALINTGLESTRARTPVALLYSACIAKET